MGIKLASHLKRNRFGLFYFRQVVPLDLRKFFAFKEISRSTGTSRRGQAIAMARQYGATADFLFARLRQMVKKKNQDVIQVFRADGTVSWTATTISDQDLGKVAGSKGSVVLDRGVIKSISFEAQPGEEEAVSRLIRLLQVAQGGSPGKSVVPEDAPLLGAEVDKYIEELSNGGTWSDATALDTRGDFNQFVAILGNVPVASLEHEDLNRLKDTLLALPANMNKLPQTKGKAVEEVLALGLPPQSANTVKKKWTRLTSFFEWLVGKGLIDLNYAKGKKPKAKARSYEKFGRNELSRLFESDEYRTGSFEEAFQYWLPVLGLYTGARIEELAQLHLADIRHDAQNSTWVIEITEEVDDLDGAATEKSVKTDASTRICPVHTAVIALGLPRYISDLRSNGFDRLFPELAPDALGKVSPRASEWFTEYRRSKGVGAITGRSRKVFHSFRHTLIASLQRAGVSLELREALV